MIRNDHRAAKADADAYALQVRETLQALSDKALAFQSSIIVGGIDRTECDAEIRRRRLSQPQLPIPRAALAQRKDTMTDTETTPIPKPPPTPEQLAEQTQRRVEYEAAARAAFPTVADAAARMIEARAAFLDIVRETAKTSSLRQVAAAAGISPEQVRRIQDGRAK